MLKVAQSFFSVQCEGNTSGVPSYFIRLAGCNLSCGMSASSVSSLKKYLEENPDISGTSDLDRKYGDLLKQGQATWVCDTISVWLQGVNLTNEQLMMRLSQEGILDRVLKGQVHLIWTGGEPTMPQHRKAITDFLNYLYETCKHIQPRVYSEIETNGSLVVDNDFYRCKYFGDPRNYIQQINCSPKLANSGMAENRRVNPDAISQIIRHPNYWFKFVVSKEEDIQEIQDSWIKQFNIPEDRIIIMPGVDNLAELSERTRFTFEMSKKYGYRAVTRSQVLAWDRTTGV